MKIILSDFEFMIRPGTIDLNKAEYKELIKNKEVKDVYIKLNIDKDEFYDEVIEDNSRALSDKHGLKISFIGSKVTYSDRN